MEPNADGVFEDMDTHPRQDPFNPDESLHKKKKLQSKKEKIKKPERRRSVMVLHGTDDLRNAEHQLIDGFRQGMNIVRSIGEILHRKF